MSIFAPAKDAEPIAQLRYCNESLKTSPPREDVGGSVTEAGLKLKNSIGFVHSTLCTLSNLEALPDMTSYHREMEAFTKVLKEVQFLEIKSMKVPVVEGLVVNYVQYTEVLKQCIEHMRKVYASVLKPYSEFLARYVSDDKMRRNHSTQCKIDFVHFNKMREANYKSLGACLKKYNPKAVHELGQAPLGTIVRNNNDWKPIIERSETLVKDVMSCNRPLINQEVHTCAEYIEVIANELKKNNKADITPAIYADVISGATTVADEIEYFNTVWLLTFGFNAAVGEAAKTVTHRLAMN